MQMVIWDIGGGSGLDSGVNSGLNCTPAGTTSSGRLGSAGEACRHPCGLPVGSDRGARVLKRYGIVSWPVFGCQLVSWSVLPVGWELWTKEAPPFISPCHVNFFPMPPPLPPPPPRSCSFLSNATFPGGLPGSRWTDRLPLVEGHFTHDGMSVIVGDSAGQVGRMLQMLRMLQSQAGMCVIVSDSAGQVGWVGWTLQMLQSQVRMPVIVGDSAGPVGSGIQHAPGAERGSGGDGCCPTGVMRVMWVPHGPGAPAGVN